MLKGLDPLLTPELLHVLAEMGHGDELVIADANFTAVALAGGRPVLRLAGAGVLPACKAVLSLLPLDADVAQPVAYMQVSATPQGYRSGLQRDVVDALAAAGWVAPGQCGAVERYAFYDRARQAHAIVQTGELQPFANFIFRKGVIAQAMAP